MTDISKQDEFDKIDSMSRYDMCRLWRFGESGHKYFDGSKPYYEYFKKRFNELGGFSPEISKSLGW